MKIFYFEMVVSCAKSIKLGSAQPAVSRYDLGQCQKGRRAESGYAMALAVHCSANSVIALCHCLGERGTPPACIVCFFARSRILWFYFFGELFVSKNIYVGNLAWSVSNDELRDMFEAFGEVISARVIEDRETGRSRGFGFVEMEDNGATEAIDALNGSMHSGRNLKVNEARPRERRPRF